MRRKVTPKAALKPHKIPQDDLRSVRSIYEKVEGRPERYELNLYIAGEDEAPEPVAAVAAGAGAEAADGEHPEATASREGSDEQ
jgi:succinate dehydrogenase iron-sulfur subunit